MSPRARLGMAGLCLAIASLAGIAAALGVFVRGGGEFVTVTSVRGEVYEIATTGVYAWNAQRIVAEGVGWDVVTLLLAVPALALTVPLVARGSVRGRLIAAGLLGYFLYMYLEYAVTWAFGPLFLLFVVICGLSLVGTGWLAWSIHADRAGLPGWDRYPRRGYAALNLAMSGLLTVLWLARISAALSGQHLLQGETTMTVQALDLGIVIPVAVASSILVLRGSTLGLAFGAAFSVTFLAMTTAITGMLVSAALVEGVTEIVPIAIFSLAVLGSLWLLWQIHGAERAIGPAGATEAAGVRRASAPMEA